MKESLFQNYGSTHRTNIIFFQQQAESFTLNRISLSLLSSNTPLHISAEGLIFHFDTVVQPPLQ